MQLYDVAALEHITIKFENVTSRTETSQNVMITYRVAGLLLVELQAVLHLVIDTLGLQGWHTHLHTIYYMNIYG